MNQLQEKYQEEIVPKLQKELDLDNPYATPKLEKIVINVGIPKTEDSPKKIETISQELADITGQQPRISRAHKSIASFGIRQGDPIGLTVTLRKGKMFDFLQKLCRIVLPQVKDFRGIKNDAFDGQGNYTLGFTEQIIFPEINYNEIDEVHGLEITFVTSSESDKQAKLLFQELGLPFVKQQANKKKKKGN